MSSSLFSMTHGCHYDTEVSCAEGWGCRTPSALPLFPAPHLRICVVREKATKPLQGCLLSLAAYFTGWLWSNLEIQ